MADDKGGGVGWEAFEVIIVILLAIGLLSRLQGKPIGSPESVTPSEITTSETTKNAQCGLAITSPRTLERVTGAITLVGSTSGCNWVATETVALYAQVVDAYGAPVSSYSVVTPTRFDSPESTTFATTIPISGTAHPGTGYLILIPAKADTQKPLTVRIPLSFK